MRVPDLLAQLSARDIRVSFDGDKLRCNAPAGALTPDLRDQLRDRKSEILEFLRTAESVARQQPAIVPLQPHGTHVPVYGVPGHTGDVFCYRDLSKHLGNDQPFYGLEPPGLDGKREPLRSIRELAAYFAKQIRAFQPEGPCVIAGYCAGGAIALEIARQFEKEGAPVSFVALFGCPYPTWYRKLQRVVHETRYWIGRVQHQSAAVTKLTSIRDRVGYIAERLRRRVETARENRQPETDPVLAVRDRVGDVTLAAVRRYSGAGYSGRVRLFVPKREWLRGNFAPLRWRLLAKDTEAYYGPDRSNEALMLLDPDAPVFAGLFRQCRDEIAAKPN